MKNEDIEFYVHALKSNKQFNWKFEIYLKKIRVSGFVCSDKLIKNFKKHFLSQVGFSNKSFK